MTKRKVEYRVIPPEQDAVFVACMEDVLETYAEAYDPRHLVLCMDEQPVQLLKETRADRRDDEAWSACRPGIRAQRHGEHFPVRRITLGIPAGDRPTAAD